MSAPQFVLWGFKASYGPEPIKLTGGNMGHCRQEQKSRNSQGFVTRIYAKFEEPTGLRLLVEELSK